MRLVVLKMPDGSERKVAENTEFTLRPGERVSHSMPDEQFESDLETIAQETGLPLGDIIARATKAFGITPCTSCEKRIKILNRIKEAGVVETIKRLKETF